jgi:membrane fusion protein (multidrug efflux system)
MRSSRSSLFPLLMLGISLSLAPLMGCNSDKDEGEAAKAQEVKPMAVEIDTVGTQTFVQTLEFPGVAQPIEVRNVSAEMGGRVLAAPAEEGALIKKGDLLLRVDARNGTAQIKLLKSQVSSAQREYNRVKKLAAEGLATPQQVDQSQSQLEQTKLGLNQAKVGQGMSTVRSPFTGVVAMKMLEVGEYAGPGQPIVQLIDTSTIKLEVTIPESMVNFIKVNDDVQVEFSSIGKAVTGKVVRRGVTVTQPTQTFPIEIHIPNESGDLMPGMRARVVVPKLQIEGAVVVPRDALLEGVFQREAMVAIDRKGDLAKAELRVVEIGESRGNSIVITQGLKAGDKLITRGHRNVVNGTVVRIVKDRTGEHKEAEVAPIKEVVAPTPEDAAPAKNEVTP